MKNHLNNISRKTDLKKNKDSVYSVKKVPRIS